MQIFINPAQQRLKDDILFATADATNFDQGEYDNTWREPINDFILLRPNKRQNEWYTSNTGIYEKYGVGDWASVVGAWNTCAVSGAAAGDFWQCSKADSVRRLVTASFGTNQGHVLSFFNYGAQESASDTPLITFGYGAQRSTSDLFWDVYPSGETDTYIDGELKYNNSISGYSPQNSQKSKQSFTFYEVIVLPYDRNRLQVYSENGGSFEFTIPTASGIYSQVAQITPDTPFFIEVPAGRQSKLQYAPLKFASIGTVISENLNFIDPPRTGAALNTFDNFSWVGPQDYLVYGSKGYSGTQTLSVQGRNWADTANFTPNGTTTEVRLKCTLTTSDDDYSPTLNAAAIAYEGSVDFTDDDPIDITQYVQTCTIDVAEDSSQCKANFKIVEVQSVLDLLPEITRSAMPVRIVDDETDGPNPDGTNTLFEGLITGATLNVDNAFTTLDIEVSDRFYLLDKQIVRERLPLAGQRFDNVMDYFAFKSGAENISIEPEDFRLPFASATDISDSGVILEVGDQYGAKLQDIVNTYAPDYIVGMFPNDTFIAKPKSSFTGKFQEPLFGTAEGAVALGFASTSVYFNLNQQFIQPEANSIRVTGKDPLTNTLFQVYKNNESSIDPTTAIASRGSDWLGYLSPYALSDPQITDISIAALACQKLYDKLSKPRYLLEFDTYMLYDEDTQRPIWKGQEIELYGIGTGRVVAVQINFLKQDIARGRYTIELED